MNGCHTGPTAITPWVTNRGNSQLVQAVFDTFQSPLETLPLSFFVFVACLCNCSSVYLKCVAHALSNWRRYFLNLLVFCLFALVFFSCSACALSATVKNTRLCIRQYSGSLPRLRCGLPPTLDSRVVYFIDRASGSNRQRLCDFIKTVFSSSTGHREYCQIWESSTTSAEWVQSLWHNQGRRNSNTNACICTLHSDFTTALQLVDEERDEDIFRQLSQVIVVFQTQASQDISMNQPKRKQCNIYQRYNKMSLWWGQRNIRSCYTCFYIRPESFLTFKQTCAYS